MKNSHLKNSLIAAGIAVFAGVVTLGANVAISATTPTQTPAAAGLVGPTFSTVTVGGIIDVAGLIKNTAGGIVGIKGPVDISGVIRNDTVANTPVIFNDGNGVAIQAGDLDIQAGGIKNSNGILNVKSSIDINGQIRNDTVAGAPVSFNDGDGVALKAGDLDVQAGLIKNSTGVLGFGSVVNFAKNAIFNGDTNIFNTGLQINGGLTMGGMNRIITNVLQINGDDVSTLRLQQPSVWMELKPNTSAKLYTAAGSAFSASNTGTATIIGSNVYGKDLNSMPTFTFTGKNLEVYGDSKIDGKITSTGGFGTIRKHDSSGKIINGGATGSHKVICDTTNYPQEKLISCGANQTGWGYLNSIVPDYGTGTCTAYVKNTDAGASTLTVYAMCLDSAN